MIHKIYANMDAFKPIKFKAGLNLILADTTADSGEKDSRNGVGKTSLINIIDFCLGANLDSKKLPTKYIKEWVFYIELDLAGHTIKASRSIQEYKNITLTGDTKFISEELNIPHNMLPDYTIDNDKWKLILGKHLFGLSLENKKYHPTFRLLMSYFARNHKSDYIEAFQTSSTKNSWQKQVSNSYLLGLNWKHSVALQDIVDEKKEITDAKKIYNDPKLSRGRLETKKLHLEKEVKDREEELATFKIHPQYQEIQNNVNSLTQVIHELANENIFLKRKLTQYEDSIITEKPPEMLNVEALYKEANLHFGDVVKKTLADAKAFHSQIIQNRKSFLEVEILELKNKIIKNNKNLEKDSNERANLMIILQEHNALDEFTRHQELFIQKKLELERIIEKLSNFIQIDTSNDDIKTRTMELVKKIKRDYDGAYFKKAQAIETFNENSQKLYNETGNLTISVSDKGKYDLDVDIPKGNSEGVGKMKIFCYDLMLVKLFSHNDMIDFLIHDSTIFDGVDSRQVARALEHAHQIGDENNFQYICTFNSDNLPTDELSDKTIIENATRLTLHDKDPKGSLLGFEFK